jgi:hypothetical protein
LFFKQNFVNVKVKFAPEFFGKDFLWMTKVDTLISFEFFCLFSFFFLFAY